MAFTLEKPLNVGFQQQFYRAWLDACAVLERDSRTYHLEKEALKQQDCSGLVHWVLNRLGIPTQKRYAARHLARYVFNRIAFESNDPAYTSIAAELNHASLDSNLFPFPIVRQPNGEWRSCPAPEIDKWGAIADNIAAWFWYDSNARAGKRITHVALQFGPSYILENTGGPTNVWPTAIDITEKVYTPPEEAPASANILTDSIRFCSSVSDDKVQLTRREAYLNAYSALHSAVESGFLVYHRTGAQITKGDFFNDNGSGGFKTLVNLRTVKPVSLNNTVNSLSTYNEGPDIVDPAATDIDLTEDPESCPNFLNRIRTCYFTEKGFVKLFALFSNSEGFVPDIATKVRLQIGAQIFIEDSPQGPYFAKHKYSDTTITTDDVIIDEPYVNLKTGVALRPHLGGVPSWLYGAYLSMINSPYRPKVTTNGFQMPSTQFVSAFSVITFLFNLGIEVISVLTTFATAVGTDVLVKVVYDRFIDRYLDEIIDLPGATTRHTSELRVKSGSGSGWYKAYLNFELVEYLASTGFVSLYTTNDSNPNVNIELIAREQKLTELAANNLTPTKSVVKIDSSQYGIPVRF